MAGKGKAYRESRRKTVVAPSGDEFVIRKPSARAINKLFASSGEPLEMPEDIEYALSDEGLREAAEAAKKQRTPEEIEELITSTDALLIECVVEPKVVADETEDDDELWVAEIDMPDYFFLYKEITELAGVTLEKLRELFRDIEGSTRPAGGLDIAPSKAET